VAHTYAEELGGRSVSIWPTVWKFALILAAFKIGYSLLVQTSGLAGTPGLGLVGFVVAVVLLVAALRSFRARNGGHMTFGQGFVIAFVASLISVVVSAAVDAVYLATAGRERLAALLETTMSQVEASPGMDAQTLQAARSFLEVVFTPGGLFFVAVLGGVIGWCIVSLILAALQKRPPPLEA